MGNDYVNGFIERKNSGRYEGTIRVEGINLSPIEALYFKKDGENYLWLKRINVLEYDETTQSYSEREAQPKWEAYLKKQMNGSVVTYKGEFNFMRFRFSIIGIWDSILGREKQQRLNLFVERLPQSEQTIINGINERKRNEQ